MDLSQIARVLHGIAHRLIGRAIAELVRELLAACVEVERALASSVFDAALLVAVAALFLMLAAAVIRSASHLRIARRDAETDQPPPGFARLLRPH